MRGNDAETSQSTTGVAGNSSGETARENGRNNSGDSGTSSSGTSDTTSTSSSGRTSGTSGVGSGATDGEGGRTGNATDGNESSRRPGAGSIPIGTETGGRIEELTDDTTSTRTRGRSSGSGSRSGGTGTRRTANQETKSLEKDLDGVKPRKVKGVVDGDDAPFTVSESAKELIGDLYMVMFWLAAQVTDTPEIKLGNDEGELLGEKTEKFVKSLGKRRATNVMKSLGKIGPAVGLVSAVAMVTVPRAKLLMGKKKSGQIPQPTEQRQDTRTTTTTTDRVAPEVVSDIRPGGNTNTGLRERSFSSGDFKDFGGEDVEQNT